MNEKIRSIIQYGADGIAVDIECTLSNSLPGIVIVGLGGKAITESKERLRSAMIQSGISIPRKRIIINLAPADIPKESTSLDLAMAAAIMLANDQSYAAIPKDSVFMGELGLDGSVRAVRGIIGKIVTAQKLGIKIFIVPKDNLQQARLIPNIHLIAVETLSDLHTMLSGSRPIQSLETNAHIKMPNTVKVADRLSLIIGQDNAKRAIAIAAAGGHNILLHGPPGTGKSMLAKAMPSILPPLSHSEMLEVTHLHSLASNDYENLCLERPFRAPHHSSSYVAMVGGGPLVKPGEVTLGHRGILFLDELPEFPKSTIEALRQPLEDHYITISRSRLTVTYPAHILLVATANPCPCGYLNSNHECSCSVNDIRRYSQRISGPIIDRIDLHVVVDKVDHGRLLDPTDTPKQNHLAQRVAQAHNIQHKRLGTDKLNAHMDNRMLVTHASLERKARTLLDQAADRLKLSARSYMKVAKVARTIADLEFEERITVQHISEALRYRPQGHVT